MKYDVLLDTNRKGQSYRVLQSGMTAAQVYEWLKAEVTAWSVTQIDIVESGGDPKESISCWKWLFQHSKFSTD